MNAIDKSEAAETCHRHNIADLAVAFQMTGGGVCDDIMDTSASHYIDEKQDKV